MIDRTHAGMYAGKPTGPTSPPSAATSDRLAQ
ncbi:hypothetical protein SNOG_00533 [Parastagonospora nodorum SN15]|uniref:Uncharacterized protein n=1 Tax=Phaeosphaeria nodorum (strain SN15 / ATCC MYA-4574 / FGSC 10173) TaxID=321614 RepID=Q0V631_PHANO|nr:hypothetical protein SNOG_00533 [Parastagonospora nodorum SN15]EAT92028.1 hypothetical protein SNOG_00533 [Parastagonospora nodorum SN15]